jgi:glycosyltransferase involved in cell wall biosynthesis
MEIPLLSVCIPTFNRQDWLAKCLEAVLPQAEALPVGLAEVVVSDNASSDGTWSYLQSLAARHPCLRIHRNPENKGQGNFDSVVQAATGRYAWLMGDDDAPLSGALEHVVKLIQESPRDFYLPHVVLDSDDPAIRRMEWFENLPRLDWNLSDPAELLDYMRHGRSGSAVFTFMSVLIFQRDGWLEAVAVRSSEFVHNGWSQVATSLEYLKQHGRLRVIPEALVNYHCSNETSGQASWHRAMIDLRGLLRVADVYFGDRPDLFDAFMGNLRKNHGEGWISLHRVSAPNQESWKESENLLLKAGYDPVKVAAVGLGADLLFMKKGAHSSLDPGSLVLADLGFIARGSRRTVVVLPKPAVPEQVAFLEALAERSHLCVLCEPGLELGMQGVEIQMVDLERFFNDKVYQDRCGETLRNFKADLFVNADPKRSLAWDIMAMAAGATAAVAFRAPERGLDPASTACTDSPYLQLVPDTSLETLLSSLGMEPKSRPWMEMTSISNVPREGVLLKLNLGCGGEHLPGWVNVDKFLASQPDLVHDLEQFPWPLLDNCAEEVLLKHVLEHLGRDSDTFLRIIQELYRVCAPGAVVRIVVPHPRHQDFLQDPTHVRPVLAEMFQHFSLAINEDWIARGLPGTPLALYLGLDFEMVSATAFLDPFWDQQFRKGAITQAELDRAVRSDNNVIQAIEVVLRAVKPFRRAETLGAGPATTEAAVPGHLLVRWEGSQFVYHSLAHVNRQLCLGLLSSGEVDLSVIPYEADQFNGAADPVFQPLAACVGKTIAGPASVHVRHQWPPKFEPPEEGAWVMIQPWEFGGIPEEWVMPMRDQVDEIWVPSTWVKDCYVQSGIPAEKVCVIRNGVDCQRFTPEGPRFHLATKRRFKFLFLGGTIHRKGIDVLLGAYREAFRASDDVCLVVKGQGGTTYRGSELHAELERIRKEDPDSPEILYLAENLDESALASLYRACDVFVMPYRGEGFGLPMAEAMACGLPVIATERGAAMDFLAEDRAWLIPCTRHSLQQVDQFQPSRAGFWLEEPSREALVDLLRQVAARPEEVIRKGRNGRAFAMNHLGWEEPSGLVLDRIRSLARKTPLRITTSPAPVVTREAFLYRPEWDSSEWVEVLLAFVTAFQAGDPVGLILLLEGSGRTAEEVQEAILYVVSQAGLQAFPDVVILAESSDTIEALAGYQEIRWIAKGMDQPAGSVRMEHLKAAYRRLKQEPA